MPVNSVELCPSVHHDDYSGQVAAGVVYDGVVLGVKFTDRVKDIWF